MKPMKMHKVQDIARLGLLLILLCGYQVSAQEKENQKAAQRYMAEAEAALSENNFPLAEAKYREAIAKDEANADARYNLGNLYYSKEKAQESAQRLNEASVLTENKELKHKAYHNQGNAFMKAKKYEQAVAAYKNALRNNPNDDETRYNLALAKEKLRDKQKQGNDNKDKKNNQDQNKDQKDKQQDQNNKDKKGGDDQPKDPQNKDQGKDKQDKDQQKGDNKKEQGDQQQDKKQQPEEQKGDQNKADQNQQQPVQGKLSPQQIKNLLEAMENQEKDIQDKINAKRVKGQQKQTDKDW